MPDKNQTLYDQFMTKIKNQKLLSGLILCGTIVMALATFSGAIKSLYIDWFEKEEHPIGVKMRYYTFKGHSISMLLKGELTNNFKQILGGTPNVWQNDVYKELVNMENRFGTTSRVGDGYMTFEDPWENIPSKYLDLPVLPGTFKFYKDYLVRWDEFSQTAEGFPVSLNDGWAIEFHRNPYIDYSDDDQIPMYSSGKILAESISFNRILNREEALEYFKETNNPHQFYKYLTKQGCPEDFFEAVLTYQGCGSYWSVDIDFPLMVLQALIIENVSGEPIHISELKGKINGGNSLKDALSKLEKIGDFEKTIGDGVFREDELLIIPTSIIFTRKPSGQQEFEEYDFALIDSDSLCQELYESINNHETYKAISKSKDKEVVYEIPKNTMASLLNNRSKKNLTEDYYYMSQAVESFKVNGRKTKVYSVDSGSMFISHGSEAGSCPFIFNQEGNSMGNVLTGRITREKEGIYSKVLPYGGSQFEIRELENEISYIKWARIKCTSKEGEVWYLNPKDERLNPQSEKYVILRKGEAVALEFDAIKMGYSNELEVYGYYELLSQGDKS